VAGLSARILQKVRASVNRRLGLGGLFLKEVIQTVTVPYCDQRLRDANQPAPKKFRFWLCLCQSGFSVVFHEAELQLRRKRWLTLER
jgi:hypothetical protein